ncbi:hypothetical protein [Bryobacter aggregatus]|uniref:hypothetical protein n=1 Tax=Bryobacter aggregatus TaxID=360054 RepID=UPI0004E1250B|nr:hypothetical protein [Bryobacter aggregatus]
MNPNHLMLLFLGFGLLGLLYLSMQIKVEMRRNELNTQKEMEQLRFQLNEQRSKWIQSFQRPEDLVQAGASFPEPVNPLKLLMKGKEESLWGMSTKSKALEMAKRGETSAKIAAVLSLPKPEIEFLIKLEKTAAQGSGA